MVSGLVGILAITLIIIVLLGALARVTLGP